MKSHLVCLASASVVVRQRRRCKVLSSAIEARALDEPPTGLNAHIVGENTLRRPKN